MDISTLKTFFESRDVAAKAASSLRDGAVVSVMLPDAACVFFRENGKNRFERAQPGDTRDPDLEISLTHGAAEALIALQSDLVGDFGVLCFELIISRDPKKKMGVRFKKGVLHLIAMGYLGILKQGGGKVMGYLATHGLANLGRIKQAIKRRMA